MADEGTGSMNKPEVERMKTLLMEAVTTLCRTGIPFTDALKVEGLVAVTIDESDIIIVNMNKTYNSPTAASKKAAEAQADQKRAAKRECSGSSTDGGVSDGGSSHEGEVSGERSRYRRKRQRKKRPSDGSDKLMEGNAQDDFTGIDIPEKRLRDDENTDSVVLHGNSSVGSPGQVSYGQSAQNCGESIHNIKIEIDSHSEDSDDKQRLTDELFGFGDGSIVAVPLEHHEQSGFTDAMAGSLPEESTFGDLMADPLPVSMFSASNMQGTSATDYPSSSGATYHGSSNTTFSSPQQGSAKVKGTGVMPPQGNTFVCPYVGCTQRHYSCRSNLLRHYKESHTSDPPEHKCPHCQYVSKQRGNVMRHMRYRHRQEMHT